MRLIGLIPARGGSRRLPGKNIRPLAGHPLLAWSVRAAKASAVLHGVVVSTDDDHIAAVALSCGAEVAGRRPAHLASDTASSHAVLVHECAAWEARHGQRLDGIVLLQPTSPFRRAATIAQAVQMFERADGRATIVSVSPARTHPWWCLSVEADGEATEFHPGGLGTRSQDLPSAYEVNGCIYVVPRDRLDTQALSDGQGLYSAERRALVQHDPVETLDIDTAEDWAKAEALAHHLPSSAT